MHLGLKSLRAFLEANRRAPALVLATVIDTEGSTYRKPGAMLLANPEGDFAGLVSGGCLESDLVTRARGVIEDGEPLRVRYDLKDDEELVLGLGLGCGGVLHLQLQRLEPADAYHPLGSAFAALDRGIACRLALVVASEGGAWPVGTAAVVAADGEVAGDSGVAAAIQDSAEPDVMDGATTRARRVRATPGPGTAELLLIDIEPTPHVLVCGAGPDALPVVRLALALGWECTVTDHRPATLAPERLPLGAEGLCTRPGRLSDALDLERIDAAVVMSHHIEHDAEYLRQLSLRPPPYLGLLGPRARKRQILDQAGLPELPVRGPVGLDIGAELPESIALAILAEIHAVLNGRSGAPLDPLPKRRRG